MKTNKTLWTAILVLGTAGVCFAGNHPALTYPAGVMVSPDSAVQMADNTPWHKGALVYASAKPEMPGASSKMDEATPWHKGALRYAKGVLVTTQPVEASLPGAKKIVLSSADVKN